jgi:hypothetical protein
LTFSAAALAAWARCAAASAALRASVADFAKMR